MAGRSDRAGLPSDSPREKAIGRLGRDLAAAWMRARAAGAAAPELTALVRERISQLRSASAVLEDSAGPISTRRHTIAYLARSRWVQDSAMTAPEFIGREDELTRLCGWVRDAFAFRPATVFLSGDAGVGKTRLLDEFAARVRGDEEGVYLLRGECVDLSEQARIPYGPLVGALGEFIREQGGHAPVPARREWQRLGGLVADSGDRPVAAQTVFAVLPRVLKQLGLHKPVVLIFEDLHWADQSTLDLVSFLARTLKDERVVLVCSHRTELNERHPLRARLAEPRLARATERIALAPFDEEEFRRFLTGVAAVDQDQMRLGYRLSGGNAFFAEELWFAGVLTDPDAGLVPDSVRDLTLARLAGLGRPARRLLGVAATAARRAGGRLLGSVGGFTADELDEALRECTGSGILVFDREARAYGFRHALLREAVYENEPETTRMQRHAAMAEAIETDTSLRLEDDPTSAVELAHHWYRAENKPKALLATLRAAAMTAHLRAFPEAETHYARALELWTEVDAPEELVGVPHARVLAEAADSARWAAHVERAVGHIREAISEVDEQERPRRSGELHERLGSYLWEAGEPEGSAQAYLDARRLLAQEGPTGATEVLVLSGLAGAAIRAGRHSEALRLGREAELLADEVGAVAERGRALNAQGMAAVMLGRAADGVPLLRESLEIARRADQLEDMLRAYGNLAFALAYVGELPEAARTALEGLDRAREFGIAFARQAGVLANNAAAALIQLGEWDRAAELLDGALLEGPPIRQSAYIRLSRLEIELGRGDFAAVERSLAELLGQRPGDPRFVGALRAYEAELALWRGDPARALETAVGALDAIWDGENAAEVLRLGALGLRAAADLRRRKGPDPAMLERTAELAARVEQTGHDDAPLPEIEVLRRQCAAERDRAFGRDSAQTWSEVARSWERLHRPYLTAYARWRQALLLNANQNADEARQIARQALEAARALGAQPLAAALGEVAGPRSAARTQLTPAQLRVARLVARGLGNAEIAEALSLSIGAVARHIHDALVRLREHGHLVRNRTGLALYVREQGLLGEEPGAAEGRSP